MEMPVTSQYMTKTPPPAALNPDPYDWSDVSITPQPEL